MAFPSTEELSVSGNHDDPDKADMRIVQASAQEVYRSSMNVILCFAITVYTSVIVHVRKCSEQNCVFCPKGAESA